mgnify:CR=1 FL=1
MKDAEDEAFDDLARRQGMWGGGFQAKRTAAADKLQEPEREALKLAVDGLEKILHTFAKDGKVVMASMIRNELFAEVNSLLQQAKAALAQPAQEDEEVCSHCGSYCHERDELDKAEREIVRLQKIIDAPKRPWVDLTDADADDLFVETQRHMIGVGSREFTRIFTRLINAKLKEKNNG